MPRALFFRYFYGSDVRSSIQMVERKIEESEEHVIICMHHPPLRSNSKHMEPKYMFTQMERFEKLCVGFPDKLFYVFAGIITWKERSSKVIFMFLLRHQLCSDRS